MRCWGMTEILETRVFRLGMSGPGDVSELAALFDQCVLDPAEVVAIIGKTEGNGGVNDFTRGFFTQTLMGLLSERLGIKAAEALERVPCVLSGGTEGVLSPHFCVFARRPARSAPESRPALAIGRAFAEEIPPEAVGHGAQCEATAAAVIAAIADAGLAPEDVRFVQVKAPGLTLARMDEARRRGASVVTTDVNRAMAMSRSAAALGAAIALGDIAADIVTDAAIGQDMSLYSSRVSVSSGIEITRSEAIVLGNSPRWAGPLRIACRAMTDALDIGAMHGALDDLEITSFPSVPETERARIKAVMVKGMPDARGTVRGYRHTMLDDTDINAQRHIRGALGGLAAAVFGDGRIFVSGGAEHQGPNGGGLVAVIAEAR
jgi:cyanuric acid amidohydrolase